MARLTVSLDDQLYEELKNQAQRQGVPLSQLVGDIVAQSHQSQNENGDSSNVNDELQEMRQEMQEFKQMIDERMQQIDETLRIGQNWIAGQEMAYVQQLVNLEILVRTGIYIGCQAMQMLKCKAFNIMALSKEQYEKFKEFFDTAAQLAKQDLVAILNAEHPYATEAVHMLPSDSLDGLVRDLIKKEKEKMQKK
jgi:hypothetical protein